MDAIIEFQQDFSGPLTRLFLSAANLRSVLYLADRDYDDGYLNMLLQYRNRPTSFCATKR